MQMRREAYERPEDPGTDGVILCFCGWEKCEKGHRFGPFIRQQYLLHFVLSGKGVYHVNKETYFLNAGEAFLIRPGESTVYEADADDPWEYTWLAFNGYGALHLLGQIGFGKEDYILKIRDIECLSAAMEQLIDAFENANSNCYERLGYFYLAMAQLWNSRAGGLSPTEDLYYRQAASYIRQNYGLPLKISDVAHFVGINRTYLYKNFMEAGGVSPKEYLLTVRLEAARDMLGTGKYTVTETALSCGFRDTAAFCNSFKRMEGRTPLAYIKRARGAAEQNTGD